MAGKKSVAIVHTSFALIEVLGELIKELIPGVRCINIVDDSLLSDVMERGEVDTNIMRRMCSCFFMAEEAKAQVALNACSTVSETVDVARAIVSIPIIKIDEPMARQAIEMGKNLGVLATVPTTIGPTSRLIEHTAMKTGKKVSIKSWLCKGGFELLMAGEKEKHDSLVMKNIEEASKKMDVVVLAQGTMARLVPQLDDQVVKKVLSSPRSGIQEVKRTLDNL